MRGRGTARRPEEEYVDLKVDAHEPFAQIADLEEALSRVVTQTTVPTDGCATDRPHPGSVPAPCIPRTHKPDTSTQNLP